ncbi:hypothetical protein ACHAXS_006229 [Conticribra weissflogii]
MRLRSGFEPNEDHSLRAQDVVNRYNAHRFSILSQATKSFFNLRRTFNDCPVIWDTGASYGLTPFRGDFIDYEECNVSVQDISKTNTVIGIGTVMWRFKATNGDELYIPFLCYHLPTADIRLLSPQTYHQLHGGKSELINNGTLVSMTLARQGPNLPQHYVEIPIDIKQTNLPIVFGVSCTDVERQEIGIHLRSCLMKHRLDFGDSYAQAQTALSRERLGFVRRWRNDLEAFDYEFQETQRFCCPCVGDDSNQNLTGPQRELLLWHWKLGVSMRRIQSMMVEHEAIDTKNVLLQLPDPAVHFM